MLQQRNPIESAEREYCEGRTQKVSKKPGGQDLGVNTSLPASPNVNKKERREY
jgi:hypothetical protein